MVVGRQKRIQASDTCGVGQVFYPNWAPDGRNIAFSGPDALILSACAGAPSLVLSVTGHPSLRLVGIHPRCRAEPCAR
jgi:hypothetical protein